jgi:CheY-like chemotaxis protein
MKILQSLRSESLDVGDESSFKVQFELSELGLQYQDDGNTNQFQNAETLPEQLREMNILIVDDDADSQELLALILADTGANITCAASASEALEVLGRLQPSLIISDIAMPDTDGYTLIQKIRAMSSKTISEIPAIALTAYDADEDRDKAFAFGFQEFITKPIDPDTLLSKVINFCKNSFTPIYTENR